jgi:hypothetical protein
MNTASHCSLASDVIAPHFALRSAHRIADSHSWAQITEQAVALSSRLAILDDYCNCSRCNALRRAYVKARHISSAITLAEAQAVAREIVTILEPYQ